MNEEAQTEKRWGYWATLGWAVAAYVAGQIAATGVALWWVRDDIGAIASNPYNGVLVALTVLILNPVTIAVVLGAIRLAKANAVEYLALVAPRPRQTVIAVAILLVLVAASDGFSYVMGHPIVTPFQWDSYKSAVAAGWLVPFVIATVIFAPVGEEILFRGFLFRGLVRSDRYAWLGIVIISVLFALPHVQYELFDLLQILAFGLFVGWVRYWSGSTLLTMLLHAMFNLEGTIETVLAIKFSS